MKTMELYASKLRRQNRDQQITSKRVMGDNTAENEGAQKTLEKLLNEVNPLLNSEISKVQRVICAFGAIDGVDASHKKALLVYIRKMLSGYESDIGDQIFKLGFLPKLLQFIESKDEEIYLNAAWALTNIVAESSDAVKYLRANKVHYRLVEIIGTANAKVREQTLWILGNMCADSSEVHEELLAASLDDVIINIVSHQPISIGLLKITCWVISVLCKARHSKFLVRIKRFIPFLLQFFSSDNLSVLSDTMWAFHHLINSERTLIEVIRKSVPLDVVCSLMRHKELPVRRPALRLIGDICLGGSSDVAAVIDAGALPCILHVLETNTESEILREAAWCISNVAADSTKTINCLISMEVLKTLRAVMEKTSKKDVHKEVFWCLANMLINADDVQVGQLVGQGIMEAITEFLTFKDVQLVMIALDGVDKMLHCGAKTGEINKNAALFEDIGGKDMLNTLLYEAGTNLTLQQRVDEIMDKYYCDENCVMEVDDPPQ
eukprot:TRINITY_DN9397_c0_g1_i16.p1 TRINITY_DN9397_c0_g1~~TRINITY_DN9397_c0_g1_i16.p1  ORF type:complete len:493 (+),score=99.85 TRINITY_DN9397_c0_g1_i16:244-1722(+)